MAQGYGLDRLVREERAAMLRHLQAMIPQLRNIATEMAEIPDSDPWAHVDWDDLDRELSRLRLFAHAYLNLRFAAATMEAADRA